MGKTRYKWWGYVKNVIRAYPEHCAQLNDIRTQSITAAYSGVTGNSGPSRTVEAVAMRELPPMERKEYEAVKKTIDKTLRLRDGAQRIQLIEMVFFKRSHTLQGAADALYISYSTAKRWHNKFIESVARNLMPDQFADTPPRG